MKNCYVISHRSHLLSISFQRELSNQIGYFHHGPQCKRSIRSLEQLNVFISYIQLWVIIYVSEQIGYKLIVIYHHTILFSYSKIPFNTKGYD